MNSNVNLDLLNIQAEQDVSNMLIYFDKEFAYDIINEHLSRRITASVPELPNICKIFSIRYNQDKLNIFNDYELDKLTDDYLNTLNASLDIILKTSNLQLSMNYTDDNLETLSIILYDFLICNFRNSIIRLFINYIYQEQDSILNYIQNSDNKRIKDIYTVYGKRTYQNQNIAIINANIELVLDMFLGNDFSLEYIITSLYDSTFSNYILNNISEISPLFDLYKSVLTNDNYKYSYIADIRLNIHQMNLVQDFAEAVIYN